jgi:hypothetical protein
MMPWLGIDVSKYRAVHKKGARINIQPRFKSNIL